MAKDFFPSLFNKKHLVEKNPPIDVVKAKYEAMGDLYSNNLEEN
ncbi:hypothetical protein CSB96_5961 [Pseudomonas aeruginosa]|nr:hypothetical protein CSB96_5961 [Pseudomonas aeruginosa]